jgi:hypothetical protein
MYFFLCGFLLRCWRGVAGAAGVAFSVTAGFAGVALGAAGVSAANETVTKERPIIIAKTIIKYFFILLILLFGIMLISMFLFT